MRIAVVNHRSTIVGGVERYLTSVIPALRARGHQLACWFEAAGPSTADVVGRSDDIPVWIEPRADQQSLAPLRAWRPDVMYMHGLRSPESEEALAEVAPAVFFAHSYYGTCVSGGKLHQFPGEMICERAFGTACLAAFYPRRCGGLSPVTLYRQFTLQTRRRHMLDGYSRVIVASEHMRREYTRNGWGHKVSVVPLPLFEMPVEREPQRSEAWRLLFLGRFEKQKGVDTALDAAALVARRVGRRVRLQLSGMGSLRAHVETRARELVQREPRLDVEVTEWLSDEDLSGALASTDLLLVPSIWPEPFGLVGIEAASHGVPAVAFDVGGIPEWLEDGVTGRLVDPRGPERTERFAEAIYRCLNDPAALARMSQASRRIPERFTTDEHLHRLERVFDDAVSGRTVERR